jgi:hypothetical protein
MNSMNINRPTTSCFQWKVGEKITFVESFLKPSLNINPKKNMSKRMKVKKTMTITIKATIIGS